MDLAESIKKLKELSIILKAKTVSDREKEFYLPELFKVIDKLEIPQLIGELDNEYVS
tara:strand:- start:787 stop:957 length:171 start_codon:yes stop_codon:yes gene_type:complete